MSTPAPDAAPGEPTERGAMPRVARPRAGLSSTAIIIGAVLAAILLFTVLDARRRALSAPAVRPARADLVGASPALPTLYIPPVPRAAAVPLPVAPATAVQLTPLSPPQAVPAPAPSPSVPPPPQSYGPPPAPAAPPRTSGGAILVIDSSQALPAGERTAPAAEGGAAQAQASTAARSRAGAMSNRATTVPQGTLIPAVLETALDSTGAGFARALVQRDVRGFDGTRVLIPRGSRLIGEYASDTSPGQKRAFVTWTA